MSDYLKKAFEELNSKDLNKLIMWLIEEKKEVYNSMIKDLDFDNDLIDLNELEEKLRTIYANLIQKEDSQDGSSTQSREKAK